MVVHYKYSSNFTPLTRQYLQLTTGMRKWGIYKVVGWIKSKRINLLIISLFKRILEQLNPVFDKSVYEKAKKKRTILTLMVNHVSSNVSEIMKRLEPEVTLSRYVFVFVNNRITVK